MLVVQVTGWYTLTKGLILQSVKYKNRVIYINGDPFLNWQTPLCNGYKINDMALWILQACAEYDVAGTWDAAVFLGRKLRDYIVKATFEVAEQGGYQLGWD